MTSSYLDHPSEEVLERFLMHRAGEDELDRVETHILACDACVSRLEELEVQLKAVKLALHELSSKPAPESTNEKRSWRAWFTFRTLSWAGAVAALALTVTLTPRFASHSIPPVDLALAANRGAEAATVPLGRPLHLHLSAQDISNGPVQVVLVDAGGSEVWKGSANVQNDLVEVNAPKLDQPGTHFLRLYSVPSDHSPGDLLREFPFEVK